MLDILVPEVGLQSSRTGVSMTKQTAKQTRSNQIVGNVGMYFVAYRLSLMGLERHANVPKRTRDRPIGL